ncbi:MAG: ribonuclease E activity regulator RraA [Gammaproteobacteria bacterium]
MTATADLYDEHGEALQVLAPIFSDFGGVISFAGPVSTVKVFEDNSLVRSALEEPGEGRVLVVDGGASMRCALVGDNLALLGRDNDWAGIVVYGCIRDAGPIGEIAIGLKAMATNPRKSVKKDQGERDVVVRFADAVIEPGQYLYADQDGIVIARTSLTT